MSLIGPFALSVAYLTNNQKYEILRQTATANSFVDKLGDDKVIQSLIDKTLNNCALALSVNADYNRWLNRHPSVDSPRMGTGRG
jgi:hypothetical protein